MNTSSFFSGDFTTLPFASTVRFGAVPVYPTADQFHNAVSRWEALRSAEAAWYLEAMKARRTWLGAADMDADALKQIALAVADRLFAARAA